MISRTSTIPSTYTRRPTKASPSPSLSRNIKPGDKAPRKVSASALWNLDKGGEWRADLLLLDYSTPRSLPSSSSSSSSATTSTSTSAPVKTMKGVGLLDRPSSSLGTEKTLAAFNGRGKGGGEGVGRAQAVEGAREVDLEGLVISGKGKREKRSTTATTLGYDFVPDHVVLSLPDTTPTPTPCPTTPVPVLSRGKDMEDGEKTPMGCTPRTPGLVRSPLATHVGKLGNGEDEEEDDDDDDDDGWERISAVSDSRHSLSSGMSNGPHEYNGDDEDLDSIIVLGEMEIEGEEFPGIDRGMKGQKRWVKDQVSYAAALGNVTK